MGAARSRTSGSRRPWVAPTIRLRLTLLYGAVFLVTGAVLLTIGYLLVRNNLSHHHQLREILAKLGRKPSTDDGLITRALGFAPGSSEAKVAHAVAKQITASALHTLLIEYLVALLAVTMASVATGYLLAGRALRPLRAITATARRVSSENLGERIALEGPNDELRELADTFDRMLARLDAAFASQRHFVANSSHELRTPLAIMRTEVDVTLVGSGRERRRAARDGRGRARDGRPLRAADRGLADARPQRGGDRARRGGRRRGARGRLHHRPASPRPGGARRGPRRARAGLDARRAGAARADGREPARQRHPPQRARRFPDGQHSRPRAGACNCACATAAPGSTRPTRSSSSSRSAVCIDPSTASASGLSIVRSVAEAHGGGATVSARDEGGLEVIVDLPALAAAPLPAPPRTQRALTKS